MDCIEFMEKYLNIKLLPHQKIIVKMLAKGDKYVFYPCRSGRSGLSDYLALREIMKIIYGELENE